MFFTDAAGIGSTAFTTVMPPICLAEAFNRSFTETSFSFIYSSTCFFRPSFSSMYLRMATFRSGALLNSERNSFIVSWMVSIIASTFAPVMASIRRTPAATELSARMRTMPILPVAETCVPPQNSMDEPNWMTRTWSPYFSPKRAMAPNSFAFSIGTLRCSVNGMLARILAFTKCSTSRSCSSVTFWKWEKSKRRESGVTSEPFCSTCVPNTWRNASSSKCVQEWLASQAARLSVSTQAIIGASRRSGNFLAKWIGRLFSFLVSMMSMVSNSLTNTPVSPT